MAATWSYSTSTLTGVNTNGIKCDIEVHNVGIDLTTSDASQYPQRIARIKVANAWTDRRQFDSRRFRYDKFSPAPFFKRSSCLIDPDGNTVAVSENYGGIPTTVAWTALTGYTGTAKAIAITITGRPVSANMFIGGVTWRHALAIPSSIRTSLSALVGHVFHEVPTHIIFFNTGNITSVGRKVGFAVIHDIAASTYLSYFNSPNHFFAAWKDNLNEIPDNDGGTFQRILIATNAAGIFFGMTPPAPPQLVTSGASTHMCGVKYNCLGGQPITVRYLWGYFKSINADITHTFYDINDQVIGTTTTTVSNTMLAAGVYSSVGSFTITPPANAVSMYRPLIVDMGGGDSFSVYSWYLVNAWTPEPLFGPDNAYLPGILAKYTP